MLGVCFSHLSVHRPGGSYLSRTVSLTVNSPTGPAEQPGFSSLLIVQSTQELAPIFRVPWDPGTQSFWLSRESGDEEASSWGNYKNQVTRYQSQGTGLCVDAFLPRRYRVWQRESKGKAEMECKDGTKLKTKKRQKQKEEEEKKDGFC